MEGRPTSQRIGDPPVNDDPLSSPYQSPEPPQAPEPFGSPFVPGSPLVLLMAPPARPRVWTVFVAFLLAMALLIAGGIATLFLLAFLWHEGPSLGPRELPGAVEQAAKNPWGLLITLAISQILLTVVATMATAMSPVRWVERLRLGRARLGPIGWIASVVGVMGVQVLFVSLGALGLLPESPMLEEFGDLLSGFAGWSLFAAVLVIGVGPGIGEELLFRGYMQTRFTERWGVLRSCLLTSLLFGAMHMDLVQGGFAMSMGLFLGYVTERCGSIRPAMVCHAVNNAAATLAASYKIDLPPDEQWHWFALGVGAAMLLAGVAAVTATARPRQLEPAMQVWPVDEPQATGPARP